ncbi:MAG TPA: hypothetical protein VFG39_04405 [Balneolaceae bacterium]|nr:hypothetical protein [Balneolaceae bacterium]
MVTDKNLFSRIINYMPHSDSVQTQLEDFCTECLAGVLQTDQQLLQDFVWEVLQIEDDTRFRVNTQQHYLQKEKRV